MNIIGCLVDTQGRLVIGLLAASLLAGIGAGFLLSRHHAPQSTKPDAPIEWNKVQSIPTRMPDAEDVEWQQRAHALDEGQISNSAAPGNRDGSSDGNESAE
jgi:hypothetical protein